MENRLTVDYYGETCPQIMYKFEQLLDRCQAGETIVVNCDNPCALKKIKRICLANQCAIDTFRIDKYVTRYIIRI